MKAIMRTCVLTMMLTMTFSMAEGQVFLADHEEEGISPRRTTDPVGYIPIVPQDIDDDWIPNNEEYVPIGSGLLALTGLAGAYLLAKRKKKC